MRRYTDAFKQHAIKRAMHDGVSTAATELGIPSSTLYKWAHYSRLISPDEVEYPIVNAEANEVAEANTVSDLCGSNDQITEPDNTGRIHIDPLFDVNSVLTEREMGMDMFDCINVSPAIKHYYFVDYENVKSAGLAGFENLGDDSCIRIYYSEACPTVPIPFAKAMCTADFHVEFTKVFLQMKNAADCQMLFELRYAFAHNKDCNFYIVSYDSDFDKPLSVYRNTLGMHVQKIDDIADVVFDHECEDLLAYAGSAFHDERSPFGSFAEHSVDSDMPSRTVKKTVRQKKESRYDRVERLFIGSDIASKSCYRKYKSAIINCVVSAANASDLNTRLCKACRDISGEKMSVLYKACKKWL